MFRLLEMVILLSLIMFSDTVAWGSNFFVVSDLHYDIFYKENYNSTYYCHEQGSRLSPMVPEPTNDLKPLGRVGCDSPKSLIETTFKNLFSINPDPDFILITGDIIAHFTSETLTPEGKYDPEYNKKMIIQSFQDVHDIIREYFPTTPLYPVMGNNDAYEDYEILPDNEETEFLKKISAIFTDLPSDFNQKGYFTVNAAYQLIALNSNYFSIYQVDHKEGCEKQLEWLRQSLSDSKGNTIIAMHIPPGINRYRLGSLSWHNLYSQEFMGIIKDYEDKISFIFSGHFHTTTFQLIHSTGLLIHLAVSPIYANNPGARYYFTAGEKSDFIDYTLDLRSGDSQWKVEIQHSLFFGAESIDLAKDYQVIASSSEKTEEYLMHSYGFGNSNVTLNQLWNFAFRTSYDLDKEQGIEATRCSIGFVNSIDYTKCLFF